MQKPNFKIEFIKLQNCPHNLDTEVIQTSEFWGLLPLQGMYCVAHLAFKHLRISMSSWIAKILNRQDLRRSGRGICNTQDLLNNAKFSSKARMNAFV